MKYETTPALKAQLIKDGHPDAELAVFEIDNKEFARHWREVQNRPAQERHDAAVYRCLTWDRPPKVPTLTPPVQSIAASSQTIVEFKGLDATVEKWGKRILLGIGVIALILIASAMAHAQNVNTAEVVTTCGTPPAVYPTAGNRAPNTVDVNGNLCAGVTVSATVNTAGLAISFGASTSGGNTGPAYPAAVYSTSAAPAYTEGKFNALSSDLSGNLRVNATVTPAALQNVNVTQVGNTSTSAGFLAVAGVVSSGTAISGGPVLVSGNSGGTSTSLSISTTGGGLKVDGSGYTQPVSGTVAGTGNFTVVQPTGTNLHAVLDTTSTTAVTQATGTNLHAVLDTTSTTAVTQATAANLNATVVGTLTNNAAAPAATNVGSLVALANAAAPTNTEGRQTLISETISGYVRTTLPAVTIYTNSAVSGVAVNAFATSALVLDSIDCQNSSTSANSFVQIFNTTSASVTPGSTSPTEQHMAPFGGGFVLPNLHTPYSNGISLIATTTAGGATGQATLCTLRAYVP